LEIKASRAFKDQQVSKVRPGFRARQESKVKQVFRVQQESKARRVFRGLPVCKESREILEFKDKQVFRV
jgi:hypothetical protein